MKFEWELLKYESVGSVQATWAGRAKVFGGWIVKTTWWIQECPNGDHQNEHEHIAMNTVFIPDPNHEWEITKE